MFLVSLLLQLTTNMQIQHGVELTPFAFQDIGMSADTHQHLFEGKDQFNFEIRTWLVMILCFSATVIEISCGTVFGSIALVADGLHMSTHCLAFFISAAAYSYARKHGSNPIFVFGTGKVIELASYTSAIILTAIAMIILYESISRFIQPETIKTDALWVAFVGFGVNVLSGLLLACRCGKVNENDPAMGHGHSHGHAKEKYAYEADEEDDGHEHNHHREDGHGHGGHDGHDHGDCDHDHGYQVYDDHSHHAHRHHMQHEYDHDHGHHTGGHVLRSGGHEHHIASHDECDNHEHGHHHDDSQLLRMEQHGDSPAHAHRQEQQSKFERDNNYRAAICHVTADAFVSILVIIALGIALNMPHTNFLDPLVAIIGSLVIISWAYTLIVDTGANLLDINPDLEMTHAIRTRVEKDGTVVNDLHVWRLGPGHLGLILAVKTDVPTRDKSYYLSRLRGFKALSHKTIDVCYEWKKTA